MITVGTRIKYLRPKHEMTIKQLGQQMGFSPASADVRIVQYENDSHTPKSELIRNLADVLEIAPEYKKVHWTFFLHAEPQSAALTVVL